MTDSTPATTCPHGNVITSDAQACFACMAGRVVPATAARRACKNCGHPIIYRRGRWTHYDDGAVKGGWQGRRCPRRLTGAEPQEGVEFDIWGGSDGT